MNTKTLINLAKLLSFCFFLMLSSACSQSDCPSCESNSNKALEPMEDMAAYLSLSRQTLYVLPKHEKMALDALNAQPVDINRFKATITPASGKTFDFVFAMSTVNNPYFFADMDYLIVANIGDAFNAIQQAIKDAIEAAKDADQNADDAVDAVEEAANAAIAAAEAAAQAALDAAGGNANNDNGGSLSWPRDNLLFDNEKGIIVWKNAQCGTPRPRSVTQCQGPIPADGEELAGMYWKTTTYSKAKCERGTTICTELRQVGSYVEIAEDNQCSIVKIIRPVDTLFYCQ